MISLAKSLERAGFTRKAQLSDDEKQAIEDILDAAVECDEGRLPLMQFARIGEIERGGQSKPVYGRVAAMQMTSNDDPRKAALKRVTDRLIRLQNVKVDARGWLYTRGELEAHRVWVEEGRRIKVEPPPT